MPFMQGRVIWSLQKVYSYRTVKNLGAKKNFGEFGKSQQFANYYANFLLHMQ